MALKGSRKGQQNAVVEPEPESDMDEMDTAGTEAGEDTNTGASTGDGGRSAPRRTYNRGPQLEWTNERQRALVRILKTPKALGTIRTASSIANALAQDPAFEGETLLTPEAVKSFMAIAVRDWKKAQEDLPEEDQRPVPAYLIPDRARRVVVNLALFDTETEDEAEDGSETETETGED